MSGTARGFPSRAARGSQGAAGPDSLPEFSPRRSGSGCSGGGRKGDREDRQALAKAGEQAAADLLRRSGLREVARNWRSGRHELDLVCLDGDTLVFVEVRTRARDGMVSPAESLTPAKRRHFVAAARAYLAACGLWDKPCRFDAVCVVDAGATLHAEHLRHVLEFSDVMDRRNPAWQPW